MENLKDWCISRQLWWGHRIPVFYCDACGWEDALEEDLDVCPKCGAPLRQDDDVLDTWFSSQLWTFATQGWPYNLEEMLGHHPTKALVTARDIIALWVARMVMSSLYFTDQIPFEDVVIYATILAKDGSRMSKSKGNGVDPMDLINMYGADAMRFNLLTLVTNNQDVRFDADIKDGALVGSPRTESARGFVTKIWNAARFVGMNLDGYTPGEPSIQTPADAWILSRLARLSTNVTKGIEQYRFGDVARDLHQFFWSEFCDWYIELSKAALKGSDAERLAAQRNLVFVLDQALRLLHPAMPFVTEAIWEQLPTSEGQPALMMAAWPEPESLSSWINDEAEKAIGLTVATVSAVRDTRARYGLSPKTEIACAVKAAPADAEALLSQADLVRNLANLSALEVGPDVERPAESAVTVEEGCEIYCDLAGMVDFAAERARLEKERAELQKDIDKLAKKLSNPGFLAKAAQEIIDKDTAKHADLCDQLERIDVQLAELV